MSAKPVFKSKNATDLLRDAEHIVLKMTENADLFANPVPSLTVLEERLEAYRTAFAEATFRDRRAVVLKGQTGVDLQETIYRLSHFVDAVALGDPAIILAAGFRIASPTTVRIGRTPKAENLRATHVQVGLGIIQLRVNPWRPARMYRYEYREKGTEEWIGFLHSKSFVELSDLTAMREYEFRVSYIGRDAILNFSDVVTALVV